jgi:AcrR family transcriptional regulator
MPKHFSGEERAEIKAKLIEAGKTMFAKYGFSKTTIADITEEARIGKGTFYLFFATKGDIFVEIYTEEWLKVNTLMMDKYLNKKGKLSDLILGYITDNRKYLSEQPLLFSVYDREALNAITDKGANNKLTRFIELSNERVETIVNSWMETNRLDVSMSPKIITAMMNCISFLSFHRDAIRGVEFDEIVKYLTKGISLVVTEHEN